MTTTDNPFRFAIQTAAAQGYCGTPRAARPVRTAAPAMATPNQASYIASLLERRDLTTETRPKFQTRLAALVSDDAEVRELTRAQASALIDYLSALPYKAPVERKVSASVAGDVPAGRYAVDNNEGGTSFYRVDRPEEGRWAGCTFVKLMVSDETINLRPQAAAEIIRRIEAAGVRESALRFGEEIGCCGVCGRTLTNAETRAARIGKKCAARMGW